MFDEKIDIDVKSLIQDDYPDGTLQLFLAEIFIRLTDLPAEERHGRFRKVLEGFFGEALPEKEHRGNINDIDEIKRIMITMYMLRLTGMNKEDALSHAISEHAYAHVVPGFIIGTGPRPALNEGEQAEVNAYRKRINRKMNADGFPYYKKLMLKDMVSIRSRYRKAEKHYDQILGSFSNFQHYAREHTNNK